MKTYISGWSEAVPVRLLRVQLRDEAECGPPHDHSHQREEDGRARAALLLLLRRHISEPLKAVETRQVFHQIFILKYLSFTIRSECLF